jgi:hypothetical protein
MTHDEAMQQQWHAGNDCRREAAAFLARRCCRIRVVSPLPVILGGVESVGRSVGPVSARRISVRTLLLAGGRSANCRSPAADGLVSGRRGQTRPYSFGSKPRPPGCSRSSWLQLLTPSCGSR